MVMIRLMVWAFTLAIVAGKDEPAFITAACKDDITLPCDALQRGQNYTSVIWYKVYNTTYSSILIYEKNIFTQTDKKNSSVSLGINASLILWDVAPAYSGTYKCLLNAKARSKLSYSFIALNISDCVSTKTKFINGNDVDEDAALSVIWAFLGLALSKLILSAVCIWVFSELRDLWKRRRRHT